MKIVYLHASKYGNGATVAAEFESQLAAKGVSVEVDHIRELKTPELTVGRPVRVQLARAVWQAAPRHAQVPEKSGTPPGDTVRALDH